MFNRKLGILIATAAITFTPVAVPQAFAQTDTAATATATDTYQDPYFSKYDMTATIPLDADGVLRDGTTVATQPLPNGAAETSVAGLPKYKIYTYEGEDFVMELRQSNKDSKGNDVLNPQGIPVWGYYILSKNGDKSDSCRIDMMTKSVNDPTLYDYTRNGFLYTLGGVENSKNPESQYLHTGIQHWGGTWRFPFSFAQGMHNLVFDVNFPTNWGAPTLSASTLFTTGTVGEHYYPTQSGGEMDVSEFMTVQPYDVAINNSKEIAGSYPTKRTYHSPDNWISPNVIDTGDPYHKQLALPYAPEDSRFVVQWDQAKLTNASTAPTDATVHVTADKFCYADAIVQQGTEKTVAAPQNQDSSTLAPMSFKPSEDTPAWVKVAPDGRLTLKPNFEIETGTYEVPVLVGTETTDFSTVMVYITVIPAFFVEGYDDAYTGPGIKTVIFPQSLRTVPEGTSFALDTSTVPDDWDVKIEPRTGKITAIPTSDAAPIRKELGVDVTYTAADGTTKTDRITAGVQVDRRVVAFNVDKAGHLIVTYNDSTTQNLGSVVGPQGQSGDSVRITGTTTDSSGNTVITFTTYGPDGTTPIKTENITVSKGDKGDPGKDAAPLTVKGSEINADGNTVITFSDGSTVTVNKGDTGATGATGADGKSITVATQSTDANGNTVLTMSDGSVITIAKGDKGDPGKDAAPLTVTGSEINAAGNTVITFSDSSTVEVPKGTDGTSVSIESTTHDDASGTTTITFSDGSQITVLDGINGQSITITGTDVNPETGETTVNFSDGTSMVIPAGQDGASIEITDSTTDQAGNTIVTFSDGSTIVLPKGANGTDGASITITGTSTDAAGNTVITFSDGSSVTIAKGADGKDGQDGKDGASITVTGSTVNERGETIVTFSDGSLITIPAPQSARITGTSTDENTGDITITFSTGESVTIPAGKNGVDGKDGKDAAPLTITGQSVDPATRLLTITFSDGSQVTLPPVQAPKIIKEEVLKLESGKTVLELTYSTGDIVDIPVPDNGTDGKSITVLEQHTQPDGSVEVVFSDGSTVTIPASAAPRIVKQETNDLGELVITWSNGQTVTIPQGPAGEQGLPGHDGQDGKDGQDGEDGQDGNAGDNSSTGSSSNQECVNAGLTVGIPLLALLPIGIVSTVDIPGAGPLFGEMNKQLARINSNIQRQLGIFNQNAANSSAQFGGAAGQVGQVIGAVAGSALLIAVGLLVANYLTKACSPESEGFLPGSSDGGSSNEGSSGSSVDSSN